MAMVLINCIHHQDLLAAQMLQDGLILQAGFCVCVWVCFVFQMVVSSSQSSARVHDFELCSSHGCNSRRSRNSFDSKHRLVFMWFGTLTQTFILPFPMEDTSCIILTVTRIMRLSRYLTDSFFVFGPWSVQCSPKQKNIASKKQHKDRHRSPSSSAAAKLRLFDKFRDMQQRWHPDFEEEVGKTVRGGLALCNFKTMKKKRNWFLQQRQQSSDLSYCWCSLFLNTKRLHQILWLWALCVMIYVLSGLQDGDSEGLDETSRTFERLVQRSALEEEVS